MLRRAFSTSRRRFLGVTHENTLTGTRHRLEFVCEPRQTTKDEETGSGVVFILYGLFVTGMLVHDIFSPPDTFYDLENRRMKLIEAKSKTSVSPHCNEQ